MTTHALPPSNCRFGLSKLFLLFLKIGAIGFGGHLALVAVVEREVVERRRYVTREQLVDAIALASILPGPVAANTVANLGYTMAGLPGTLVTVLGLTIPSFILMVLLAMTYEALEHLAWVQSVFAGFLPAVIGILLSVAARIARDHVRGLFQGLLLIAAAIILLAFSGFLVGVGLVLGAATVGILVYSHHPQQTGPVENALHAHPSPRPILLFALLFSIASIVVALSTVTPEFRPLQKLWTSFASMSLAMFGGGYVFIPMMKATVVSEFGWLTGKEFADAIALGQVTPGPIMISATFIGYRVAGIFGAVIATVAIFLPPALLTALCSDLSRRLARSRYVAAAFRAIRPVVVGMIIASAIVLARSVELTFINALLTAASFVLTYRYKLDTLYVIPAAGAVGLVSSLF